MADTKEIINCPACNNKMDKLFIRTMGKNIDICSKCGGIFFDNREFKLVDEKHENIDEIEEYIKNKEFIKIHYKGVRTCPSCGSKMVKNSIEIQIDDCYTCGGKFLDGGELQDYRDEFENEDERSKSFTGLLKAAVYKELEKEKEKEKEKNKVL